MKATSVPFFSAAGRAAGCAGRAPGKIQLTANTRVVRRHSGHPTCLKGGCGSDEFSGRFLALVAACEASALPARSSSARGRIAWRERSSRGSIAPGDVLVTFGQPMSDHLAGLTIKRRLGAPWIAHFSDPWSDNPYLWLNPVSRIRPRRMECQVLAAVDHAMFTSHETMELVMRKYPEGWRQGERAASRLRSSVPSASHPRRGNATACWLCHSGNFYGRRNPLMLVRALSCCFGRSPECWTM